MSLEKYIFPSFLASINGAFKLETKTLSGSFSQNAAIA